MGKLTGPQQKVLTPVIEAHPDYIDRATIANVTGYSASSGGFNNLLGSLRTLGLIDYPAKGRVKAEPVLFLSG